MSRYRHLCKVNTKTAKTIMLRDFCMPSPVGGAYFNLMQRIMRPLLGQRKNTIMKRRGKPLRYSVSPLRGFVYCHSPYSILQGYLHGWSRRPRQIRRPENITFLMSSSWSKMKRATMELRMADVESFSGPQYFMRSSTFFSDSSM